jgi:hypothetical protein
MSAPLIRLADRIRGANALPCIDPIAFNDENAFWMQGIIEDVSSALRAGVPVITGDNVSEFYYNGSDQEHWDIKTDFPCLVQPFPRFWVEWTQPSQVRSRVYGVQAAEMSAFPLMGHLVTVCRPIDAARHWHRSNKDAYVDLITGCAWVWRFQPIGFISGRIADTMGSGDMFAVPVGDYWLTTDAIGNVVNYVCATHANGMAVTGQPYVDLLGREAPMFLHAGLLTISFLNLKNGTLTPAALRAPAKFAKAYERRRGQELVRYHTVVVDPNRTSKPALPGAGTGRSMPVHLVRGTLVTYADEDGRRLFGKYHGTFFRPPHVRGSAKEGISHHDYRVKAPKQPEVA